MFPKTASSHEIQRNYRQIFDEVMATKEPVVVLSNNKPQVIIVDLKQYEENQKKMETFEIQSAIHALVIAKNEKKEGKLKKLDSLADLMN